MNGNFGRFLAALGLGLWLGGPAALADTFGSGANSFSIDFVSIGSLGNPPDTTDRPVTDGAVTYPYRIGKYEISEQMIDKANALGGLGITKDMRGPDYPATSITWYEAAKFVNWLDVSSGSLPAYKFDASGNFQLWTPIDPGYNANNLYRNSLAHYFLPSINEWHKAAYYDPAAGTYSDYPTGSNSVPDGIDFPGDPSFEAVYFDEGLNSGPNDVANVGLLSPYGTAGQGGNVSEWEETAFDRLNDNPGEGRENRGGSWGGTASIMTASNDGIGFVPSFEGNFLGFRVVSVVPEPKVLPLVAICFLFVSVSGTRRGRRRM